MNNIYLNNNTKTNQIEKNTNQAQYIKLRPIILKKRQVSSNIKNANNLKKFILETYTRKNTFNRNENEEEFSKYTEKLENSMNGYHLSYSNDYDDEDNSLDKYINKKDKQIIKKVHDLNNSYDNRVMSPKSKENNIKIEINEMNYPNPIKSLGIIRNNRHIYNELNKNIITRQSESFNKQIE